MATQNNKAIAMDDIHQIGNAPGIGRGHFRTIRNAIAFGELECEYLNAFKGMGALPFSKFIAKIQAHQNHQKFNIANRIKGNV